MTKGPTPHRLHDYLCRCLGLEWYLQDPGDGRTFPQISASCLVWALLVGKVLRVASFYGLEGLVQLAGGRLGVTTHFGDDTLAYFTERLSVDRLRQALAALLQRAKRNKAFEGATHIGLALDGTSAGRSRQCRCRLCRPLGGMHGHWFAALSVVGASLDLPFDADHYATGDGELTAGKRLLERAVRLLGRRFATYLVADGLYAAASFIHLAEKLGLAVVIALKENLPELLQAARARFENTPAHRRFSYKGGWVELWDADDFEPWEGLGWPAVRVLRYRHVRADGKTFDAYWLTSFRPTQVGPRALFRMAKSRWAGIENHGFNDGKNRYGLKHIPHHEPNSVRVHTLLTFLAMCLERLYRLRFLRRGTRSPYSAMEFVRLLWLNLGGLKAWDSS